MDRYGLTGRLLEDALVAAAAGALWSRMRPVHVMPAGVLRSRCADDMNSGLSPVDDAAHPSKSKLFFEWWYFDAALDDGHRCVLELQKPNLANFPSDECAMLFDVYTPEGVKYNNIVPFPSSLWRASEETCDVALGCNTIAGYYPEYRVKFEHENLACDLVFENLMPGWSRGAGELIFGKPRKNRSFGWLVPQPRASVAGTLTIDGVERAVTGQGYHDHNWGTVLLPLYMSHWIWGRLTTDRFTMIFADLFMTRRAGGIRFPVLFLALDDRIVLESSEVTFDIGDHTMDSKGFQLYPCCFDMEFGERDVEGRFHFEVSRELEMMDAIGRVLPKPLANLLANAVSAPVYYRFLSDYTGRISVAGEEYELGGETIWEYMVLNLRRGKVPRPGLRLPI
jgi:predicted secreted hydrolase